MERGSKRIRWNGTMGRASLLSEAPPGEEHRRRKADVGGTGQRVIEERGQAPEAGLDHATQSVHRQAYSLVKERRGTHALSTQGADGHFGAQFRGDARAKSPKFKSPKRSIRQGRRGGCVRRDGARRFFSRIREEPKKTDTLVRCGAVISRC